MGRNPTDGNGDPGRSPGSGDSLEREQSRSPGKSPASGEQPWSRSRAGSQGESVQRQSGRENCGGLEQTRRKIFRKEAFQERRTRQKSRGRKLSKRGNREKAAAPGEVRSRPGPAARQREPPVPGMKPGADLVPAEAAERPPSGASSGSSWSCPETAGRSRIKAWTDPFYNHRFFDIGIKCASWRLDYWVLEHSESSLLEMPCR